MMATWTKKSLGELLRFASGKSIKPGGVGSVPVFGSNGIIGGTHAELYPSGIVVGRVGAYCGSVARARTPFWASDNTIVATPVENELDLRFGEHLLRHLNLNRWAGGAAQPLLTQTVLKGLEVRVPPLSVQLRIADILTAYDDLIENNTRRIKILEEMARSLYREWFVEFRFPGSNEVGGQMLPPGWTSSTLGDLADIQWGDTTTTKASYVDAGFVAYSASGADGFLDHADVSHDGVVLSAIGAQCGKTWYARGQWSCIKNTIRFWATPQAPISTAYLFHATFGQSYWPRRGAAQPFISLGDARKRPIAVPPAWLMQKFETPANDLQVEIDLLSQKSAVLTATRDLVLPRLMSGEISVAHAVP